MCTTGVKLSESPLYVNDYIRRTDSGEIFMNEGRPGCAIVRFDRESNRSSRFFRRIDGPMYIVQEATIG